MVGYPIQGSGSGGGGSGSSIWGGITGTLSEQTDLQTVLDAKLEASDLSDVGYSSVATTATLPASPEVGDIFEYIGTGENWVINAANTQTIQMLDQHTVTGGYIYSDSGYACVCLVYIGPNTWVVKSSIGTIYLYNITIP